MFNTFLKPVHEQLDEEGYFAPVTDAAVHYQAPEIGYRGTAVRRTLLLVLCLAAAVVVTVCCVSLIGDLVG